MSDYQEESSELFQALLRFRRNKSDLRTMGKLCLSEMEVFGIIKGLFEEEDGAVPLRMSEISKKAGLSKPALSQIVNKLEDKGLVERTFSKEDRRATYLRCTDLGLVVYDRERERMSETLNNIVREMGVADSKELIRLLNRLGDIIKENFDAKEQGEVKE